MTKIQARVPAGLQLFYASPHAHAVGEVVSRNSGKRLVLKFLALDGLDFDESRRGRVERGAMFFDDVLRLLMSLGDYFAYLSVNLTSDFLQLFAIDALAEHCRPCRGGKCDGAHFVRHAVPSHHVARERCQYL